MLYFERYKTETLAAWIQAISRTWVCTWSLVCLGMMMRWSVGRLLVGINVPALSGFFADPENGLRGLVIGFAGTPAMPAKRAATALRSVIDRTDTIALV